MVGGLELPGACSSPAAAAAQQRCGASRSGSNCGYTTPFFPTAGLGSGLYFIGYALCQIPANMAMTRIGGPRWLGFICVVWGEPCDFTHLLDACLATILLCRQVAHRCFLSKC